MRERTLDIPEGMSSAEMAKILISEGYCRCSNKYRTAWRIDSPNWERHTYLRLQGNNPYKPSIYRMVSKDVIVIPASVLKLLPHTHDNNAPKVYLPPVRFAKDRDGSFWSESKP